MDLIALSLCKLREKTCDYLAMYCLKEGWQPVPQNSERFDLHIKSGLCAQKPSSEAFEIFSQIGDRSTTQKGSFDQLSFLTGLSSCHTSL